MKDDKENYIGMQIGVLDNDCNIVKDVIIKDVIKTSDGMEMYLCDDGILYHEHDLNFKYKASIGALFALFLEKYGYVSKDKAFEKPMEEYEKEVEDFMQMMIDSGYVGKSEN